MVGMNEHLHVAITTQVECRVTIDGFRLAFAQILHHHTQCLFVGLRQLWLTGVCHTVDARRQDIVNRTLVVVLLDIDSTHLQGSGVCTIGQRLLIDTPLTTYQVKRTKTQHDRLLKLGEEHSHKTYGGKVADTSHAIVILCQRDAELIPANLFFVTITQRSSIFTDVCNEVMSQTHVLRTDAYLILEIAFILVEGVVLIDILHIRIGLV